jgi:hypothetical protein
MGAVGLDWQVAGFADISGNPGESDMLMRNKNTGALEVYDIANNAITFAASIGSVGLDWQVGGVAVDPPVAAGGAMNQPVAGAMGASDDSTAQLVQAMADFDGGSAAANGLNTVAPSADTSQQTLLTTPQHG